MEIIIIIITGLSAAIFAWGCIMLGARNRVLMEELRSLEEQSHIEGQEYFKAMREAHAKIQSLEETGRVPVGQIWEERSAKDYGG